MEGKNRIKKEFFENIGVSPMKFTVLEIASGDLGVKSWLNFRAQ